MSDDQAYDDTYSQISSIDFDIWGNDSIKNGSALGKGEGIVIPDLHENNNPKKGGLIDPRLGPCSHDQYCATCGLDMTFCDGHFGHIDLAEMVFHIGYLPFVHKILTCICIRCAKLLIYKNEDDIKDVLKMRSGKDRMSYIRAACKNVTYCQGNNYGCGAQVAKIKVESKKSSSAINIVAETEADGKEEGELVKKKNRYTLPPEAVYDILKNISDEDCRILGIDPERSRPEDMIHKVFPVPPNSMRPSARGDFTGGSSMEDDLTHKLADIVKANMRLAKNKENQGENTSKYNPDHAHLLQYHVGTYVENESMTLLKSEQKGKPFKSLASRLKGKPGRVRGNLMGKRGDFTGRSVITSDPTISTNQLGVPVRIAMNLTFPETVTPYNIDYLNTLVKNGRDVYPGANFVFPASQTIPGRKTKQIDLRYRKEGIELHYGDLVERHLKDDDIVLLNRQPTLHKQSMMGHRIKVINNSELMTYRLSVAVTTPYNADFDGDEMNIFVPQSIQTQIELEEIAAVERQIISPTTSKTIVGIVQDGLLGSYNLTSPTVRIDWRNAMNIMSYTSLEDFSHIKKGKDYTGSELYSLIIPSGINLNRVNLKIKNGKIIEGRLTKDALGAGKKNNLVQLIWDAHGVEETKKFIDDTQRLINNFNLWHGFSCGIGDTHVTEDIYEKIDQMFQTRELKIEHIITEMENNPDFLKKDIYEFKLFSELNIIRDDVSKLIMSNLSATNSFNIMASSGSKGDATNIGQMSGCLGLQAFEGKIMPKKYNGRTLAYFFQNDDRAVSRGLVKQSFVRGLEWPQYVFHLMASRLGIIEQAIKSVSGDTPIIIQENEETIDVDIGKWIDNLMEKNNKNVVKDGDYDMESLELKHEVYIPTCDEKGNTSWGKVTSVTRHDPTKEMYKITSCSGREVITADSKSLLVWKDDKFIPMTPMDAKIGDYIPSVQNLCDPPKINTFIDMTKYYSKNEYLHGFPEEFYLTKENGIFIGLFLAGGNVDIENEFVQITTNENSVQDFVKKWFYKNNITYKIKTEVRNMGNDKNGNDIIETCTEIKGCSLMLGRFLTKFVGNGSKNKYVPNEAFSAPKDFIIGLIDGYFSGDGCVGENVITVGSMSRKLIEGINFLCARLGIFNKISISELKENKLKTKNILPINTISITGQWISILREIMFFTNEEKNKILISASEEESHKNFNEKNNVVFDKILSIEKINTKGYNKLYDMTIPSTFNFNIRNGLCIRDTAETGYAQRKLIKSMEDVMIKYDNSVRSANDGIIQFVYGDSGADTTKQSEYTIKLLEMDNDQVKDSHKFTDQELKNFPGYSSKENDKVYKEILYLRDIIRESVQKAKMNYIASTTSFMLPINLNRIIDTISGTPLKSVNELTPQYIVQQLEALLTNEMTTIICMSEEERKNVNSFKNNDERLHKLVLRTSLYDSLSPKKVLINKQLNKSQFDAIITDISMNFNKNIIEPGEMAGIIAAQSVGEPLTQMTLNSVDWKEKIFVRDMSRDINSMIEIGKFIDELLEKNVSNVKRIGDNREDEMGDIYYLDVKDKQYYIPSVDEDGHISWKLIEAITKHLPINKDGTDTLLEVNTQMGKKVMATKGKSFLTRKNGKLVCTRGDEIKVGDYLPTIRNFPTNINQDTKYDLTCHFSKYEYVYGSEIEKARKIKMENNNKGISNWFTDYNGKEYIVPYGRQDSLKYVLDGYTSQLFKPGFIYPKKCKNTTTLIPELIDLEETFGFIIGAYISEGCCTDTQVRITNNSKEYRNKVEEFCKKYNIGHHESEQYKKLSDNPQYDIVLHSTLFAKLMKELCGKMAYNKKLPDFVFTANKKFINGLLDGYISGDGHVTGSISKNNKDHSIVLSSISKTLIEQFSLLFTRFGIISKVSQNTKVIKNNIGTKEENIHDVYVLTIRNDNIKKLEDLNLILDYKNERLKTCKERTYIHGSGMHDKVPDVKLECTKLLLNRNFRRTKRFEDYKENVIHIDDINNLYEKYDKNISKDELELLKNIIQSDVYYDKIISIEEVKPTTKYVYDFTIEDTKTFCLANTICMYDSFHHSGIATMSSQLGGVPRIREILGVSKKPKTPSMFIYFENEFAQNKDMAHKIASHIKHTTLGEVRGRINVYYDPNPTEKGSIMEKDNIKQVFHHHKGTRTGCQQDINGLPWLMRIELDREKMLDKEVNLLEINTKFCSWWEKRFSENKLMRKEERKVINKITQLAVLSNTDNDKQPVVHIRFNVKDTDKDKDRFDLSTIDNFIDHIIDTFKLKGINGITDIPAIQEERSLSYNPENGKEEKKSQYVVYTTGVNLTEIRYLTGIDLKKTISNNIVEMYNVFGIEIARAILLREIANAYERAGKGDVNYQHISMIVDQMTATGQINSVDRHGMNKSDNDPLSRASFEKTVEQLLIAAVYGETDHMKGVSSRIMAGSVIKGGTGYCDIELDTDMIEKSEYLESMEKTKKFTELNKGTLAEDIIKKKSGRHGFVPM